MLSLRKIKASYLKIDYQFVRDMLKDDNDRIIVEATIQLAHALGMSAIAEGVETQEQLESLKQLGCDMAQGYFIAKPLEIEAAKNFIRTQ